MSKDTELRDGLAFMTVRISIYMLIGWVLLFIACIYGTTYLEARDGFHLEYELGHAWWSGPTLFFTRAAYTIMMLAIFVSFIGTCAVLGERWDKDKK